MKDTKERHYGKYRGTVVNPVDPLLKGRVLAAVTIGGTPLQLWAEACTPFAGPLVGFYAIPIAGAGVWIEFEEGNLDKPIWTGCWWREGEVLAMLSPDIPPPTPATSPQTVVLRVPNSRLKLEMLTGTITLEMLIPPTKIQIDPIKGIEISYGPNKIRVGPLGIDLNPSI